MNRYHAHCRSGLRLSCSLAGLWLAWCGATGSFAAPPGYLKTTIPLAAPPVGLAFDSDGVLYALEEAELLSNQATLRAIRPDGSYAASFPVIGDDPVNFFVGGMTYDPLTDRLLITDNTGDGRLYAVDKNGSRTTLATGIPTIAVPVVRTTGEVFVTTTLGDNLGQVLEVDRSSGATSVVLAGLDYGAGLAFDASGDLVVQEVDFHTFRGRLHRVPITQTPAGLAFGPAVLLMDDMQSGYAVAVDSEGDIFTTGNGGLYRVTKSPPAESLFYTDGSVAPIATAMAFDPAAQPFERYAGPSGGRLALNADFGFVKNDLFVTLLTPTVPGDYDASGIVDAADYDRWKAAFGSNDLAADGNLDGVVDAADYTVWRNHVGIPLGSGGVAGPIVPEPAAWNLAGAAMVTVLIWVAGLRSAVPVDWRYCQCASNC